MMTVRETNFSEASRVYMMMYKSIQKNTNLMESVYGYF